MNIVWFLILLRMYLIVFVSQFRNLFDSIDKNDMKETGNYRHALEQEAAREKEVRYFHSQPSTTYQARG